MEVACCTFQQIQMVEVCLNRNILVASISWKAEPNVLQIIYLYLKNFLLKLVVSVLIETNANYI